MRQGININREGMNRIICISIVVLSILSLNISVHICRAQILYPLNFQQDSTTCINSNLLSIILYADSLNTINRNNDTLYLFEYLEDYLFESRSHYIIKSERLFHNDNWDLDSTICIEKDSAPIRVSWLPMYMKDALIKNDSNFISLVRSWYEKQHPIYISNSFYSRMHFKYYELVVNNNKIFMKKSMDFMFDPFDTNIFDEIYDEVGRLNNAGKFITKNERYSYSKSKFALIIDSIYQNAPYYELLRSNEKIIMWQKFYVEKMIDSLKLIDYNNDTVYYELCYNKESIGENRAGILTNSKRMYLYESFDKNIVWDTLIGSYKQYYWGGRKEDLMSIYYSKAIEKYNVLYFFLSGPLNILLYNLTRNWQDEYDYSNNSFKDNRDPRDYRRHIIISTNEMLNNKDILKDDFIRIITRIEFKDGQAVKVTTQMRIGEFYIWSRI